MTVATTAALRVVIYARYSSGRSRDESLEDQIRVCRSYAERHGWIVQEVLQDTAISGGSSFRSGYQTLLEQARLRRFDIVVSEALDRLSRDQSDVAGLYKRLTFAGIAIHTVAEGLVSELDVGLKGTMNALFLKDLAAKTHRGLLGRVEAGKSGGGLSYGYQVASTSTDGPDGTETRELIRSLIERVVITSTPDGNATEVELVGGIAAMINPAMNAKWARRHKLSGPMTDAFASSVQVVAGTRNHRQLTPVRVSC